MSINRGMDKEDVVHIYSGILLSKGLSIHTLVSPLSPRMPKIACLIRKVEENQGTLTDSISQLLAMWPLGSTSPQLTC